MVKIDRPYQIKENDNGVWLRFDLLDPAQSQQHYQIWPQAGVTGGILKRNEKLLQLR